MKKILFLVVILASQSAFALYELSASYGYKKTNYDPQTYEETETGTASLAYYFWGLSGLEVDFTRGVAMLTQPLYSIYQDLTAYGANLLFTIANTNSTFKPYIKVGGAWVIKNIRYIYTGQLIPYTLPNTKSGIAPGAGFGFKFSIGPQLEIKLGIDASTSPLNGDPVTYDFGFNAGLGFLF